MEHQQKADRINSIALALAPCLRDKWDFSSDAQFTDWAKMAIKAATSFDEVMKTEVQSACKRDDEEYARRVEERKAEVDKIKAEQEAKK